MRIHSNTLTERDLHSAIVSVSDAAPLIYLAEWPVAHGSRSHKRAFEARLRGEGARHTRRPMGGGTDYAATYDDWGYWLAELYRIDPDMKAGPYKNAQDFYEKTNWAFS